VSYWYLQKQEVFYLQPDLLNLDHNTSEKINIHRASNWKKKEVFSGWQKAASPSKIGAARAPVKYQGQYLDNIVFYID
jgi:hypothetical protein